jgi:hypothetical protein
MWFPPLMMWTVVGGLVVAAVVLANLSGVSADEKSTSFMSMRKVCVCGCALKASGRSAKITLYTQHGIVLNAAHSEKRCRSCGRGFFYSFHTHGRYLHYDDTCLEQPFLITSRRTGFSIDLLYEWSLCILHHSSR